MAQRPRDVGPVRRYWQQRGKPLLEFLKPLPEEPTRDQYSQAVKDRDAFVDLFIGPHAVFELPRAPPGAQRSYEAELCEKIKIQYAKHMAIIDDRLHYSPDQHVNLRTSLIGPMHRNFERPFPTLLARPGIADLLRWRITYIAIDMADGWRTDPAHSDAIIWLGYLAWATLDPLSQARVILYALRYSKEMQDKHERRQELLASTGAQRGQSANVASLAHRHVPYITSRQSRRSAMTEGQLQTRWK